MQQSCVACQIQAPPVSKAPSSALLPGILSSGPSASIIFDTTSAVLSASPQQAAAATSSCC